jgi:hypothetical protein
MRATQTASHSFLRSIVHESCWCQGQKVTALVWGKFCLFCHLCARRDRLFLVLHLISKHTRSARRTGLEVHTCDPFLSFRVASSRLRRSLRPTSARLLQRLHTRPMTCIASCCSLTHPALAPLLCLAKRTPRPYRGEMCLEPLCKCHARAQPPQL